MLIATYFTNLACTDCPGRISGLQALLEGAPSPPDCKLLWHRAIEELLDGTRDGSKHPWTLKSKTKLNGRTEHSNSRAESIE